MNKGFLIELNQKHNIVGKKMHLNDFYTPSGLVKSQFRELTLTMTRIHPERNFFFWESKSAPCSCVWLLHTNEAACQDTSKKPTCPHFLLWFRHHKTSLKSRYAKATSYHCQTKESGDIYSVWWLRSLVTCWEKHTATARRCIPRLGRATAWKFILLASHFSSYVSHGFRRSPSPFLGALVTWVEKLGVRKRGWLTPFLHCHLRKKVSIKAALYGLRS